MMKVSSAADETAQFLENYRFGQRMIEMNRYRRDYFSSRKKNFSDAVLTSGKEEPDAGMEFIGEDDEAYLKAKMFEIKRFVTSLPPDDRKLFLYYHYIKCETVERCGELLRISRRSAFRLKHSALEYAAMRYRSYAKKTDE